jgi:WD40 repeat protein
VRYYTVGLVFSVNTGIRIMDLAITSDGEKLIACSDKRIKIINLNDKTEQCSMLESDAITSVVLSQDDKYLLVNLAVSEIHLWNIDKQVIEKKYFGQKQGRFVIRSCFGGVNEHFILSGSEGISEFYARLAGLYMESR